MQDLHKTSLWMQVRRNGFEYSKWRKKWYIQNLHMHSVWRNGGGGSYRGDQTLVQWRFKVRTGKKRFRLMEVLKEWVGEVRMWKNV